MHVSGNSESVRLVDEVLRHLLIVIRKGVTISERDVMYAIQMAKSNTLEYFIELYEEEITKNAKGKPVRVKTLGQRQYVAAIKKHDLVFGIGRREQEKPIWQSLWLFMHLKMDTSRELF